MTTENAINVLRHLSPPRTSKAAFDAFRQAIDMAIEALEQHEPHWIPVIERLPKKSGVYTVTDHKGDVVRFVFNAHSESSYLYWYRCAKAWMPLPEPYKEVTT